MNITFIGGGSLRVLPIVRSLLDKKELFDGGSIRLVDLQLERAEAVGRMIMRCPEFQNIKCQVLWTNNLEEGLNGTDILYVTMAIERQPSLMQSNRLANEYGIWSSDNLSANGAFLAARGAAAIMSFARAMEKMCPKALMLIFANPVAVFSNMVNTQTKIKALGICAGFHNHKWDIPHLIEREKKHEDNIDVVATGVNHLSFILRGIWNERKIEDIFDENLLSDNWQTIQTDKSCESQMTVDCLNLMQRLYKRFGIMIFSSEGDGFSHIFPEEIKKIVPLNCFYAMSAERLEKQSKDKQNALYDKFFHALRSNDDSIWVDVHENRMFHKDIYDISNPIVDAIGYGKTFRIVASAANMGAVHGFPDDAALEYTIDIKNNDLMPVANQYVPSPFKGLIASLSESQTILAQAVGNKDPHLFANALESYPTQRFTKTRNEYYKKMFTIYSDLPEVYQHAIDFLDY